jgi:hypothetical protein
LTARTRRDLLVIQQKRKELVVFVIPLLLEDGFLLSSLLLENL